MPTVAASGPDERLQSLAVSAAHGDPAAFGELYSLAGRRVYGLCRHMLGSPEAAEDATSEVFLKVHRAFQNAAGGVTTGSYNPEHRFLPWLLSIAGHFCVDQLRRRGLETRIFAAPKYETDQENGIDPASRPARARTRQTAATAQHP